MSSRHSNIRFSTSRVRLSTSKFRSSMSGIASSTPNLRFRHSNSNLSKSTNIVSLCNTWLFLCKTLKIHAPELSIDIKLGQIWRNELEVEASNSKQAQLWVQLCSMITHIVIVLWTLMGGISWIVTTLEYNLCFSDESSPLSTIIDGSTSKRCPRHHESSPLSTIIKVLLIIRRHCRQ